MNNPSSDRERGRSSSSSSYFNANINPHGRRGAFRGPNAGNDGAANSANGGDANNLDGGVDANGGNRREEGAGRLLRGGGGGGGLGAIASGVAASNERYNRDDVRRQQQQQQRGIGMGGGGQSPGKLGGGDGYYGSNVGTSPRVVVGGGGPRYGPRAGPGSVGGGIGGGDTFMADMRRQLDRGGDGPPLPMRPPGGGGGGDNDPRINPNLRYEESDYSEYVKRLRRTSGVGPGPGPLPPPLGGGMRDLEEEVERLRTENALLKRSCQELMNNFNELSNRLFDVDECLKKVAKVFPSEDEMESLEWLMRR